MLVGFAEGLGAAKTYAQREHYDIDVNRELLALGGASLAGGLSSGMVVNGSLSKTAVNGSAGARTQLSGLIVAVLAVITLLLLTGLFEKLPRRRWPPSSSPRSSSSSTCPRRGGCTGSTGGAGRGRSR
jgi:sulfate permease, SulP family